MRKLSVLILAGMMLAGCSVLPSAKSRSMATYTLSPAAASTAAAGAICPAALRVLAVEAGPPWASNGLAYTDTRYRVSTFAYHQWAAPPAAMLTDVLVKSISEGGLYKGVLGPTDPGDADLALAVRIVSGPLQTFPPSSGGKNEAPESSSESLSLAATLAATATGKLVASRSFSAQTSAAPDPYGGVVAANQLVGQLVGEILTWLGNTGGGGVCQGGG